jgi:Tol biopolymer transport system component
MKRCPECRRSYTDETLNYCLDDGAALVEGPASTDGEATEILSGTSLPDDATRPQIAASDKTASENSFSSKEFVFSAIGRNKIGTVVVGIILLVVAGGFGYGIYSLFRGSGAQAGPRAVQNNYKLQSLTANGNIREAAISPDGKYLAYTENSNGEAGVWIKQISTNSNHEIVPPTKNDYFALKFSPDGQFIYYGLIEPSAGVGTIYRVPFLGGNPIKIVENVGGPPSFSPDGAQFVFVRFDINASRASLVIVNSDGSGERVLASRQGHEYYSSESIAWSPDGKMIACSLGDDTQEHTDLLATVDVSTGETREFGKQRLDKVGYPVWLHDQSGLLFVASDKGHNVPSQVWQISFPSGETRQLTHDLTDHLYLTVTADDKTIVSIQREDFAGVWYSTNADVNNAQLISKPKHEGSWGMTLAPDGRIVYVSNVSGATEVWIMNKDGSDARQLTNDGISKYTPTVTGDGRYIVFVSEKGGEHLWRINLDGTQPIQLTSGGSEANPRASRDGKWVVYDSWTNGTERLFRLPIDGGEPTMLTDHTATESDISPDGKFVACFYLNEQGNKNWAIGIIPFEGGEPVKFLPVPQTVAVDNSPLYTPDGKSVTYIDWTGDVSNLWSVPIDGGPAKQLTNYKKDYIFRREWTRDGKQVAIVRGSETSDAVMITDFK